MTKVYFVRHAEPNYNNHDDLTRELTEKGLRDRTIVSAFLEDKEIELVLSSPFKRAYDTVRHFADSKKMEIGIVEDFRERKIDNYWIPDFNSFCERQWKDFDYKLADGESLREVQTRNIKALKQVLEQHPGRHIVIGGHGTAISTVLNYYDPTFVYERYDKVRRLMPFVAELDFEGQECVGIKIHNLFEWSKTKEALGRLRNMTSIYLTCGERVLLLYRQGSKVADRMWIGAAGGHFEEKELNDAKACVLRELYEELHIKESMLKNLTLRYITLRRTEMEIRQNYYFFAELLGGTEMDFSSNEGTLKWFRYEELEDLNMPFSAKHMMSHWVSTGRFTEDIYVGVSTGERAVFTELPAFG